MIVENESNWRTDDLESLLESITGMKGFRLRSHINKGTLVLFTTSRRKTPRVGSWAHQQSYKIPIAEMDVSGRKYHNTVIIKIRSSKALKMEVLDRLATVPDEAEQDMSAVNVIKLTDCIAHALGDWPGSQLSFDWAANSNMRSRPKVTRSKTAVQRRVECLRHEQDNIRNYLTSKIEKIERKIEKLQR